MSFSKVLVLDKGGEFFGYDLTKFIEFYNNIAIYFYPMLEKCKKITPCILSI